MNYAAAALIRKLLALGMALDRISQKVDCKPPTLAMLLRGDRRADPPPDLVQRLQLLLAEQTRASH